MAGDKQNARQLYKDGLEQARAISMDEGVVEASRALHRIDAGMEYGGGSGKPTEEKD